MSFTVLSATLENSSNLRFGGLFGVGQIHVNLLINHLRDRANVIKCSASGIGKMTQSFPGRDNNLSATCNISSWESVSQWRASVLVSSGFLVELIKKGGLQVITSYE